ncbi:MAG TPA: DUF2314 domain-containing protein [Steroidobacteraceae bacterium]|nr:DUF2314 domain-containing protein [Steroidobacteraceae bacterium]
MKTARLLLCVGSLACTFAFAAATPRVSTKLPGKKGQVLTMFADEPVMLRAIRRARAELDDFFRVVDSPKSYQSNFSVRVAMREAGGGEYLWISGFREGDTLYEGVVDQDVHPPSAFKRGDKFTFKRADIVDWTYTDTREGRVHGAYTECALLTLAPADVAQKIRTEHKIDCDF